MITPTDIIATIIICASLAGCVHCIWRGRKVMLEWMKQEEIARINKIRNRAWLEDENNPANWYLKNPNKFRKVK